MIMHEHECEYEFIHNLLKIIYSAQFISFLHGELKLVHHQVTKRNSIAFNFTYYFYCAKCSFTKLLGRMCLNMTHELTEVNNKEAAKCV